MKQYEITSMTKGLGCSTPVIIEAGSPATAIKQYCKKCNMSEQPVKLTTKLMAYLLDHGWTNMEIASLPTLIVELTNNNNPITGNTTWVFL
jgi:hypothetical protein